MKRTFHRTFKKQFKKLPEKTRVEFMRRLRMFESDPNTRILNVHKLKGEFSMYMSMNINSDVRALFVQNSDEIIFAKIGTHSELY